MEGFLLCLMFVPALCALLPDGCFGNGKRRAWEVLRDLADDCAISSPEKQQEELESARPPRPATPGRRQNLRLSVAGMTITLVVVLGSGMPWAAARPALLAVLAFVVVLSGAFRLREAGLKTSARRSVEFYLPLVMERIVMAVQAGLDIVPAIKAVVTQAGTAAVEYAAPDPVGRLLKSVLTLTENGLPLERALQQTAVECDCTALKHAFIHLAIAQREGGELIFPLKELSDATQLYYQDSIEEEIARLPVKATIPLLCIFSGLVICFITSPVIQVLNMTVAAMPR